MTINTTSNCHDMYAKEAMIPKFIAAAITVFLFQFRGLHHQPPAGDQTYLGYGNFLTAP